MARQGGPLCLWGATLASCGLVVQRSFLRSFIPSRLAQPGAAACTGCRPPWERPQACPAAHAARSPAGARPAHTASLAPTCQAAKCTVPCPFCLFCRCCWCRLLCPRAQTCQSTNGCAGGGWGAALDRETRPGEQGGPSQQRPGAACEQSVPLPPLANGGGVRGASMDEPPRPACPTSPRPALQHGARDRGAHQRAVRHPHPRAHLPPG